MTQHRFLIYSYISCAAIAIGSVGPWASGYLGYAGASGSGILSLIGAAVAALAIWRWNISRSLVMLILAQVAGSVCTAVAIYAVYYDVYGPYVDAGDMWIQYVGWGLILTLLGAIALSVLSLRQYRRNRTENRWRIGFFAGVIPVAVIGLWVAVAIASDNSESEPYLSPAEPGRAIPAYALKIVGGKVESAGWEVWVFGRERENCLATSTVKRKSPSEGHSIGNIEESYCGLDVPPRYWQQVVEGPVGDRDDRRSVLFFLTRRDVGGLDILTGQDEHSGRGPTWTSVKAQVIPKRQAHRAHLDPNIGFAVAAVPNPACIRRVMVFNWMGNGVKRTPLFPCKPPSLGFQLP